MPFAQHAWLDAPHAWQVPAAQLLPLSQTDPVQQGCVLPPQATQLPASQTVAPVQAVPFVQHGWFKPPQSTHAPFEHTELPLHTSPVQQGFPLAPHSPQVPLEHACPGSHASPVLQHGCVGPPHLHCPCTQRPSGQRSPSSGTAAEQAPLTQSDFMQGFRSVQSAHDPPVCPHTAVLSPGSQVSPSQHPFAQHAPP